MRKWIDNKEETLNTDKEKGRYERMEGIYYKTIQRK